MGGRAVRVFVGAVLSKAASASSAQPLRVCAARLRTAAGACPGDHGRPRAPARRTGKRGAHRARTLRGGHLNVQPADFTATLFNQPPLQQSVGRSCLGDRRTRGLSVRSQRADAHRPQRRNFVEGLRLDGDSRRMTSGAAVRRPGARRSRLAARAGCSATCSPLALFSATRDIYRSRSRSTRSAWSAGRASGWPCAVGCWRRLPACSSRYAERYSRARLGGPPAARSRSGLRGGARSWWLDDHSPHLARGSAAPRSWGSSASSSPAAAGAPVVATAAVCAWLTICSARSAAPLPPGGDRAQIHRQLVADAGDRRDRRHRGVRSVAVQGAQRNLQRGIHHTPHASAPPLGRVTSAGAQNVSRPPLPRLRQESSRACRTCAASDSTAVGSLTMARDGVGDGASGLGRESDSAQPAARRGPCAGDRAAAPRRLDVLSQSWRATSCIGRSLTSRRRGGSLCA